MQKYATGLLERSHAIGELSTQQDRLTLTVLQANLHGFIDGYEFRQYVGRPQCDILL